MVVLVVAVRLGVVLVHPSSLSAALVVLGVPSIVSLAPLAGVGA